MFAGALLGCPGWSPNFPKAVAIKHAVASVSDTRRLLLRRCWGCVSCSCICDVEADGGQPLSQSREAVAITMTLLATLWSA